MIGVPFIYFTLLTLYLLRKRKGKIDLAIVITAMYAISGLFSILVDFFNLRYPDAVGYQITPLASFSYCALITMCLIPLVKYSNLHITYIRPLKNTMIIKIIAIVSLFWFFIFVIYSFGSFISVLGSDMEAARAAVYAGEQSEWMGNMPSLLRYTMLPLNLLFGCSWAFVFLAFYSRYVQKMPTIYFWIFLIVSLSGPYKAVLGADRSKVAYWIISLAGMYILFAPVLAKAQKKQLIRIGLLIVGVLALYLGAMTIARFGERDYGGDVSGTEGGLVSYLGQSYIHYCLYFDNYQPPYSHLGIIFPFISKYLFGIESGAVLIQEEMSMLTRYNCGVFYTFIGQIIMGAGKSVAIAFCFVYTFISSISLPSITRSSGAKITSLYLYFAISSVLLLGLFVHYYTSSALTFSLFAIYFIIYISEKS